MDKTKHGLKHIPFWLRIRAFTKREKKRRRREREKRRREREKRRRKEEVFKVWNMCMEISYRNYGGVWFFYLMLNKTSFELNVE